MTVRAGLCWWDYNTFEVALSFHMSFLGLGSD
jgi:hypothetical protein